MVVERARGSRRRGRERVEGRGRTGVAGDGEQRRVGGGGVGDERVQEGVQSALAQHTEATGPFRGEQYALERLRPLLDDGDGSGGHFNL